MKFVSEQPEIEATTTKVGHIVAVVARSGRNLRFHIADGTHEDASYIEMLSRPAAAVRNGRTAQFFMVTIQPAGAEYARSIDIHDIERVEPIEAFEMPQ